MRGSHYCLSFRLCAAFLGFQMQALSLACILSCLCAVILMVMSGVTPVFSTHRGVHCISMYIAGWPSSNFPHDGRMSSSGAGGIQTHTIEMNPLSRQRVLRLSQASVTASFEVAYGSPGCTTNTYFLLSAMKLRQGNVFTHVCQSFCSRGCLPQSMLGYTPSRYPLGRYIPWAGTPPGQVPPRQEHPLPPDRYTPFPRGR